MVKSYGAADTHGTPLTPQMHYRIASVTKTFTADAVLHLVQQGRLSLTAPLCRYVKGIPNGCEITIGDLLSMRGGVYDFTSNQQFNLSYSRNPLLPTWVPGSIIGKPVDTDVTFSNPLVPWTAGAIVSTVPDMVKYARELGTGVGLTPRLWTLRRTWGPLTHTGPKLHYCLGLTQLGDWICHDGSIFGYTDIVFYLPKRHASVVVMANAGNGVSVLAEKVWGEIVKRLYPGTIFDWPKSPPFTG